MNQQKGYFGLIDCNNFYASCERIFLPHLINKPVMVLSNNDGCVIARSNEVKALGIKMGEPFFKCKALVKKHNINVFSTNFPLYGDISQRVMQTIKNFCPKVEIYSIDEAFVYIQELPQLKSQSFQNLQEYGYFLRKTILKRCGIPVSIGLAPTKTLSKVANELAKKHKKLNGVLHIKKNDPNLDKYLELTPISDVWGIGRAYTKKLQKYNIKNASDLVNAPNELTRKIFNVSGQRTILELQGRSCHNLKQISSKSKSIRTSRSFKFEIEKLSDLQKAVAKYTTIACRKLRKEKQIAGGITTFITTSRFKKDNFYSNCSTIGINDATDYTPKLIKIALKSLGIIYKKGFKYKKAGILLSPILPKKDKQNSLFQQSTLNRKNDTLSQIIDQVNMKWGKNTIHSSAIGVKSNCFDTQQEMRSKRYTTVWEEIPEV